jgi:hypothetical protein
MLFLSALISGLFQLVSHLVVRLYFPQLGLIPRYVIGTLCLLVPATVVTGWAVALPFWLCAFVSGAAVAAGYWIGDKINAWRDAQNDLELAKLSEAEVRKLLKGVLHATTEEED